MRAFAVFLLMTSLSLGAAPRRPKTAGPVASAKEAKEIAERETGGEALGARKVALNGASGGWEVEVRMPREDRGWRCVVDCDSRSVFTKTRIPNPESNNKKRR